MAVIAMECEKCGGEIEYDHVAGRYICSSCGTKYLFTQEDDFYIVADELIRYTGRSSCVVVPEGIRKIKHDAFGGLSVVEVTLPSTLEVFNTNIFSECPDIERIIISEGIKVIYGCGEHYLKNTRHHIEEIEIPESVEKIEGNPFKEFGVRKLRIHHELNYYFSESDYAPYNKDLYYYRHSVAKYPWIWKGLEMVITPTGIVNYAEFSAECIETYMKEKKEEDNINRLKRIERENEKLRKQKEKEDEKKQAEEELKRKEQMRIAEKKAKECSNLSIIAFMIAVWCVFFMPCGEIAVLLGVLDYVLPNNRNKKKTAAVWAIVLGLIETLFSVYIDVVMKGLWIV